MGAWGPAIFSDDTAADTRDTFTTFVAEGFSSEEATERTIAESADMLADKDEVTVFWLALAATQWKLGRLLESVRDRAIAIIDSGSGLERWFEGGKSLLNQRKKHLAKLRDQLLSPQPKPKKLKSIVKSSTNFQPGDVALFHLENHAAVRFCVLELSSDRGGTYAQICLLGLYDGQPFDKDSLLISETLGPHYTMLSHEPTELINLERRGVGIPDHNQIETRRAWINLPVHGKATWWHKFPEDLRNVFPKLGWV